MTQRILGIETSCDETAAAVVADGRVVLSNVVHSQIHLHERWRGVVPEVASRSHTMRILPILQQALDDAGVKPHELDAVAVTHRPGMIGCLLVGMAAAKALALRFSLPLLAVDHVQAHVHTALLAEPQLQFPALCLVASGGHTAMYLLRAPLDAVRLGTTRDDAAGEALDKGAALLGLPYPGGPAIERAALEGKADRFNLPRPMVRGNQGPDDEDWFDFSFSGLKTSLLYLLRGPGAVAPPRALDEPELRDLAASYQEAVVDALLQKLTRAADRHAPKSLCIGGGVARNQRLRERLQQEPRLRALQLVLPEMNLCSDNGAMIALMGHLQLQQGMLADMTLEPVATPQAGGKAKPR